MVIFIGVGIGVEKKNRRWNLDVRKKIVVGIGVEKKIGVGT